MTTCPFLKLPRLLLQLMMISWAYSGSSAHITIIISISSLYFQLFTTHVRSNISSLFHSRWYKLHLVEHTTLNFVWIATQRKSTCQLKKFVFCLSQSVIKFVELGFILNLFILKSFDKLTLKSILKRNLCLPWSLFGSTEYCKLYFDFYNSKNPAGICGGFSCEKWDFHSTKKDVNHSSRGLF